MLSNSPMDNSDIPMTPEVDAQGSQDAPVAEPAWPNFSGYPEESVADLIQSVQRHAFEQDRSTDDRWISVYLGTCLSGEAMIWFSGLDEKTRNNWTKLRKALVNRFGSKPQTLATSTLAVPTAQQAHALKLQTERMRAIQLAYVAASTAQTREREPNELRGHVEVFVPEQNLLLGFLAHSFPLAGTTISIAGNKISSALVSFVPDQDGKPVQLRAGGGNPDVFHPYIGLALDQSLLQSQGQSSYQQPQCLFNPMAMGSQASTMYNPAQQVSTLLQMGNQISQAQYPQLQRMMQLQQLAQTQSMTPTWTMKPCTESSQNERYRLAAKTTNLWEKASAAVWKYDTNTKELGLTWMNDDGTQEQLAVFVQRQALNYENFRIVMHRTQDNPVEAPNLGQGQAFQNIPVKLFFAPED
ncbi:hypothetical protein FRC01_003372 [Tulasnella sp. 417]|nr:hypothetical protein FRC01_003372 [Tulasnella sp. 417]